MCAKVQRIQGRELLLQCPAVIQRVDERSLFLKVTVYFTAERPVLFKRSRVGVKIHLRPFYAELPDQFMIDQAVLQGEFGRGIFCNTAANGFRLGQYIRNPGAL